MTLSTYTHLSIVADRSGSMADGRLEASRGINLMLADQFSEADRITVTLTQFDTEIDTVARMATDRFDYDLEPRGSTALLDAVAHEIHRTGEDLAALPEADRPGKVLFVIVTDGHENASRLFNFEQVSELIRQQREQFQWEFQFIGPEMASWQGEQLGVKTSRSSGSRKSMSSQYFALNNSLKEFRKPESKDFLMDEWIADDKDFDA